MTSKNWRLYHWEISSVKPKEWSDYLYVVQVLDVLGTHWTVSTKSYDVCDFMLDAKVSIDDLLHKYVVVRESIDWDLLRLFLDDSYPENQNVDNKLLYRYDRSMLHDYINVDMRKVYKILYDAQTEQVLAPRDQEEVRLLLHSLPLYVLDYFYLHGYLRLHEFCPEHIEKIYLASSIYELAKMKVSSHHIFEQHQETYYKKYLDVVFRKESAMGFDLFISYVDRICYEIETDIDNKESSSLHIAVMDRYASLSPKLKYYMLPEEPIYPFDKKTVTYVTCLYFIQDIRERYSQDPSFEKDLWTLLDVAEHYYRWVIPNTLPDDNSPAHILDDDLHIDEIFHFATWVHLVVESCFRSVCKRLEAEYERWVHVQKIYREVVADELDKKLDGSTNKLQRFFYCVYLLQCIREKEIAANE